MAGVHATHKLGLSLRYTLGYTLAPSLEYTLRYALGFTIFPSIQDQPSASTIFLRSRPNRARQAGQNKLILAHFTMYILSIPVVGLSKCRGGRQVGIDVIGLAGRPKIFQEARRADTRLSRCTHATLTLTLLLKLTPTYTLGLTLGLSLTYRLGLSLVRWASY